SYVYTKENRAYVIKAHHPDQVHSGGARHGGNLLILCQAHHVKYGDAITRSQIAHSLETGEVDRQVTFRGVSRVKNLLAGVVIEVSIATTGESLKLFFSNEHRNFWIEAKRAYKPGAIPQ